MFPLRSTFLALPLENDALRAFANYQQLLTDCSDCLSFQNPHTPHLTLMFWPEVGDLEYRGIAEHALKIAAKTAPFSLSIIEPDTFSARGRDTVLFFRVAFSPELALLKKSCPWTDRRAFHPHITLARIHHPERFSVVKKDVLKRLRGTAFPMLCRSLRLYGNIDGRKQTPLYDMPFQAC